MELRTRSSDELRAEARRFAASLVGGVAARVVTLSGALGAGKTNFAQGIAGAFGVVDTVSSPTFVIQKIYATARGPFKKLIHIDAYRLKGSHELEMLGWREIAADPGNLILIEWPERTPDLLPPDALRVTFDIEGDGRIISIDGGAENS